MRLVFWPAFKCGLGCLEATVKVVQAARAAKNFVSFNWIGYGVFRQDYLMNDFDRAQSIGWTKGLNLVLSYQVWQDEAAMTAWRVDESRHFVQRIGREEVFSDYRIRIAQAIYEA